MLRELHIANLAVIEDVSIELAEGLNCVTGQTGAGKSLILGAFEILLAMRAGSLVDLIRPGAAEARVSGLFELHDPEVCAQVGAILDAPFAPGQQLLLTRRLLPSGRTSTAVNGQPATSAMVRAVGEVLVDVHGQHDHQYLLRPANQLLILDAYAQAHDLRRRFAADCAQRRDLIRRRAALQASRTLRRQQLELYEFQAAEIDAAAPTAGELAQLQARHQLLSNLQRIRTQAGQVHAALYESEGSILERLQMAVHVLLELAELDESLREVVEPVRAATLSLQDSAFELGRYVDRLDLDPAELVEVEQRLNVLNRLVSKYADRAPAGAQPLAATLAYRQEIGRQIERLRAENEDLDQIDARIQDLAEQLASTGRHLSEKRRRAARRLAPLVEAELADLGMAEARFLIEFETVELASTATGDGGDGAGGTGAAGAPEERGGSASGLERIEMLVRTNPGQPARPLRRIASGGELSRIMLAIKSILSQADRTSVLVFDEVDANVGGRMGTVIGTKLRALAGGGSRRTTTSAGPATRAQGGVVHQVLCITHLPQIAAFADHHLRIAKIIEGRGRSRQTRTAVSVLDDAARIEELAEMLAGRNATSTTRRQAQELRQSAMG